MISYIGKEKCTYSEIDLKMEQLLNAFIQQIKNTSDEKKHQK